MAAACLESGMPGTHRLTRLCLCRLAVLVGCVQGHWLQPIWCEPTCPQGMCRQPGPCPGEEETQLLTVRRDPGLGGPGRVKGIAFI